MKKVRLGLCIGNREYANRFTSCLMNHFKEQFELHIYTDVKLLMKAAESFDAVVFSDYTGSLELIKGDVPLVYLCDTDEDVTKIVEGGACLVDKYQEVNRIVDEILKQIGEEIRQVKENGCLQKSPQILAVYSLAENEYQLPFAVTLASILGEKERVLLLDLQENSGLSQLMNCETISGYGMEELFLMAESGSYSKGRLVSCIGHLEQTDVVYPVNNTECLCEVQNDTYQKLFQMLAQEMEYSTLILNMGSRFVGFFELLGGCQEVYLMKSRGGLGQWREQEFTAELEKHKTGRWKDNLREIQLPLMTSPMVSCERLIEQWKWNELGDSIRRMIPEVMSVG